LAKWLGNGFLKDCYIKYKKHEYQAKQRNVPFLLSFSEWMKIWKDSGHFKERGCNKDQYCMARIGDKGPYAVGNVKIILHGDNTKEGHCGKTRSEETKQKISLSAKGNQKWKGKKHSEETKDKIRMKRLGSNHTEETKAKISALQKGKPQVGGVKNHSEATKLKISATLRIRKQREDKNAVDLVEHNPECSG